ncbi:hypothetical protein EDD22DRAFT_996801 [Suillus occidentalis]|nr:hypothetical protein EDD22DRAFT_996801 [Suillus occidentalis]
MNARRDVRDAPFNLGRFGTIINVVAVLWIMFVTVLVFSMPAVIPVTRWSSGLFSRERAEVMIVPVDYASTVFVGFGVISAVWYIIRRTNTLLRILGLYFVLKEFWATFMMENNGLPHRRTGHESRLKSLHGKIHHLAAATTLASVTNLKRRRGNRILVSPCELCHLGQQFFVLLKDYMVGETQVSQMI